MSDRGSLSEKAFHLRPLDGVVVVQRADNGWTLPNGTFEAPLSRHEQCMGLAPMKIFLSHKGVDKEMVRRFEKLLRALGFDPWLDDDAMPAGSSRTALSSRALRIRARRYFFVTPQFEDKRWLATEIEYAHVEKREKGDRFSIITLCLSKDGQQGKVPDLLTNYIYKSPAHELEAMVEIIERCRSDWGNRDFNEKRGTEAPRPSSRVAVLAPLIHFSNISTATDRRRSVNEAPDASEI